MYNYPHTENYQAQFYQLSNIHIINIPAIWGDPGCNFISASVNEIILEATFTGHRKAASEGSCWFKTLVLLPAANRFHLQPAASPCWVEWLSIA